MSKKIVMIGAGGHASVLAEILYNLNNDIYAVVSQETPKNRQLFSHMRHFSSDDEVTCLSPEDYILVNGIGSMPRHQIRYDVARKFRMLGFDFMSVVADSAIVSRGCEIGNGVQILTRAIVQPGCIIGNDVIINTGAIVEHDCQIGDGSHLAPGVVLSGGVNLAGYVHVGTNASIIQGISVAGHSIIGAGVTINKDIDYAAIVYPAKSYIRSLKDDG